VTAVIRRLLASLTCLAAGALSCGSFSPPPSHEPPPVSLAAPAIDSVDELSDPMLERVSRYLSDRRSGLSEVEIEQVSAAIVRDANALGIDPMLVIAVIHVESRGNAYALSPVGAMGMMQIMPRTGEELAAQLDIPWNGPQTLFDALANVRMGIAYLKQLETRYGSMATALAAYNWGPGRIDSRLRSGAALPVVYSGAVLKSYRAP